MRSKCSFIEMRDRELLAAYNMAVSEGGAMLENAAVSAAVNSPCSRFWVTPECAAKAIMRIRKGDRLSEMKPIRQEMFFEIYSRYAAMEKQRRAEGCNTLDICIEAVDQPAPKFYINCTTAMKIIVRMKRRIQCEKISMLLHRR